MPSDGGEEAVAPKCLRSRQRQSGMSSTLRAMQPVVRGVSMSKVEDVCLHTRLFPKESCLKLESTVPIWDQKDPKRRF